MEIQDNNLCPSCYVAYSTTDSFCNGCGFPLQAEKKEQERYLSERIVKEIDLSELNKKVEKACNSLYWIAGLTAVTALILVFVADEESRPALLVTNIVLVGAFLAFAVWSKTKPATALISGLSLYVIVQLLNAIVNPINILSGIVIKIIIIAYLINGIKSVLEVEKIKKELNID